MKKKNTQYTKNGDHGIWSHHFVAYRWRKNRNSDTFLFSWAPKSLWMETAVTKLKDACFLEGKLMTNLDSILKSRDTTLVTKIHIVKAMVFLVVTYRCENWTMKKTECQRTNAFKLWCWRRFLRVLWNARRPNQSILKEINPEYSLELLLLTWRRKWQPAPIFVPGESHGQRSLAGYSPQGRKSQTRFNDKTTNPVAEAETQIFWPLDAKSQLIGKDSDTGQD